MIKKITLKKLNAQSFMKGSKKTNSSFNALFKEASYTAIVYGKLSMIAASEPKTEGDFRKLMGTYYGSSTTDYPYTIVDKSTRNKVALVANVPYAIIYFECPKSKPDTIKRKLS